MLIVSPVLDLSKGFVFSPLRAPHCGLLFGLWFFLFSSLVPLPGAFSFICLFIYLKRLN